MKVTFERLVGPEYMTPVMRVTQGKDMYTTKMPNISTWYEMLLSEHSSDRAVKYRVFIEDIPYYAHVHLVRHSVGFEPHVYSQRDDHGISLVTDKDEAKQGNLINMCFDANAQALISLARKRLCYKSHRVCQDFVKKLKCALIYDGDEYDKVLGNLLMRNCSWWRGYCAEPVPCGRVTNVTKLSDIHKKALDDQD